MKIALTDRKIHKIFYHISVFVNPPAPSFRKVARVIGYKISSVSAVEYGSCHYRNIENDNNCCSEMVKMDF